MVIRTRSSCKGQNTNMRNLLLLIITATVFLSVSFRPGFGGKKEAYRNYYVGTFYFQEGQLGSAVRSFRRAYSAVPDEYNFALALALALGRDGQVDQALSILQEGAIYLSPDDPEHLKKIALRHYVTGMAQIYSEQFNPAIASLKSSLGLLESMDEPKLLSIVYNSLGYAALLDQGNNAHKSKDRPEHIHIHRRDMERNLENFAAALQFDGSNEAARHNYEMLCDSLQITPVDYPKTAARGSGDLANYGDIPANIYTLLDFSPYDEIVFLLDISGSMVMEKVTCVDEDRFKVMKETAMYMFQKIPENKQLGIGTIGGDCGTVPRLWHPVGDLSRKDFRYALDFLVPDGTTPLLNILMDSPDLFSDNPETSKSIFLVSDGANICKIGNTDICEWADLLAGRQISINILTFLNADLSNTNAFAEYTCLAQNTYGELIYIDANRCNARPFAFNLVEQCPLFLPKLEKLNCLGPAVKNLWGVYK